MNEKSGPPAGIAPPPGFRPVPGRGKAGFVSIDVDPDARTVRAAVQQAAPFRLEPSPAPASPEPEPPANSPADLGYTQRPVSPPSPPPATEPSPLAPLPTDGTGAACAAAFADPRVRQVGRDPKFREWFVGVRKEADGKTVFFFGPTIAAAHQKAIDHMKAKGGKA